jgi:hypothetical protein
MHTNNRTMTRRSQRNGSSRSPLHVKDERVLQELVTELYTIVGFALTRFGVSNAVKRRGAARSWKMVGTPKTSGTVLRDLTCLGELTHAWKSEPAFLDKEGFPRVLELKGVGNTFETLARRFFPKKPFTFVADLALRHADVGATKGGRIALLGSSVINSNVADSTPSALAQLVRQIDQIVLTSTYNHRVAKAGGRNRRFERLCHAVISRKEFDELMHELRPQMHDLCERVDALFQQRQVRNLDSRRALCVANVGLYISRCDQLERAGYDATPFSLKASRHIRS